MPTLDYAHVRPSRPNRWGIGVAMFGLVPTAILLFAVFDNAANGDPVPTLERFKAYHFICLTVVLLSLVWLAVLLRASPGRWRLLVCIGALAWIGINSYWTYLFLVDFRGDVSSQYFKTQWDPLPGGGS